VAGKEGSTEPEKGDRLTFPFWLNPPLFPFSRWWPAIMLIYPVLARIWYVSSFLPSFPPSLPPSLPPPSAIHIPQFYPSPPPSPPPSLPSFHPPLQVLCLPLHDLRGVGARDSPQGLPHLQTKKVA